MCTDFTPLEVRDACFEEFIEWELHRGEWDLYGMGKVNPSTPQDEFGVFKWGLTSRMTVEPNPR